MSQRVNILYSIKLDELADEVKRLLEKVQTNLETLSAGDIAVGGNLLSLETLRGITQHREDLAEIDHRLLDVMNIVSGYISFHTNETYNTQREQVVQQTSQDPTPTQTLETLEDKLQLFRTSLEDNHEVPHQG